MAYNKKIIVSLLCLVIGIVIILFGSYKYNTLESMNYDSFLICLIIGICLLVVGLGYVICYVKIQCTNNKITPHINLSELTISNAPYISSPTEKIYDGGI